MDDTKALIRLMSWLSPVFPTGSFAYSAGLETAVAQCAVKDASDLHAWVSAQIAHGSLWNDCVFLVEAQRNANSASPAFDELVDLAIAMQPASERRNEAIAQGKSFTAAAIHWIDLTGKLPDDAPLPICIGCASGIVRIDLHHVLAAYCHAFATNHMQAAIRLSVIGQSQAAETMAGLECVIAQTVKRASATTIDDLGTSTFMADIAAMNHETLQPRLFLS